MFLDTLPIIPFIPLKPLQPTAIKFAFNISAVFIRKIGTQSLSKNYQTSLHTYDILGHQILRKE